MSDEAQISELLLRWEELREQGQAISAEELCRDCPELLPRLREHIRALEALEPILAETATPVPEGISADLAEKPVVPGYEVLSELGRGGMGVVYKARVARLGKLVALKTLPPSLHASPAQVARFRAEAGAVARINHANVVHILDVGEANGRPFFAMELLEGGSLAERLGGVPQPPEQSAQLVEQLARGVHAAHRQGVVHRDLKPSNILLTAAGQPKVTDFGLAKTLGGPDGHTVSGAVLGTPSYMAPEQARGATVGPAVDIYALGAILYEMLTGQPPFRGDTPVDTVLQVRFQDCVPPSRLQPTVPYDLETVCLKCLRKDPARRYASAETLADDLLALQEGRSVTARRVPSWERLGAWFRKRRPLTLSLGAGVAACLVLFADRSPAGLAALAAAAGLLVAIGWLSYRLHAALRAGAEQQRNVERNVERLRLVLEMSCRLVTTRDLDVLLRLIGEYAIRLVHAESATVYLVDRDRGELWSRVLLNDRLQRICLPLGVGVAGTVALSGETLNVPDAYADSRFHPEVDQVSGYRTHSLLTLPLSSRGGRILGVFQLVNKRGGPFTDEDVEVISLLRESAAIAVENARLASEKPGPPDEAAHPSP